MIHLLAPTEHSLHDYYKANNTRYRVSSLPEAHGCDIVCITQRGLVGFQRKTLPDLHSSLLDGRLYMELAQLQSSASITYAFLIIESELRRTIDGTLLDSTLTIDALRSIIAKFAASGVGYLPSSSVSDTAQAISGVSGYLGSGEAGYIRRPKQLRNEWGEVTSEAYALWLLQSFPGIGPSMAQAIHKHFNGVPIKWSVTADDLQQVPGIGKKTAKQLIKALTPPNP